MATNIEKKKTGNLGNLIDRSDSDISALVKLMRLSLPEAWIKAFEADADVARAAAALVDALDRVEL
jgi:hypothetical protein